MSHFATAWAMHQDTGNAPAKLVLLILADCHNQETGLCFPSRKTIAERGCMAERTVAKSLALLEEQELIKRHQRYADDGAQMTTRYELVMPSLSVLKNTPKMKLEPQNAPSEPEPAKEPPFNVWQVFVRLGGNRGLLGRLIKEHGEKAVKEAVAAMLVNPPADPNGALRANLKGGGKTGEYQVPKADDELVAWAAQWSYPAPDTYSNAGSYHQYRNFLWDCVRERKAGRAAA